MNQRYICSVLVVDDDADTRCYISEMLMGIGVHSIHIAEGAKDALSVIKAHNIELVITDLNMPGVDGLEFMKLIVRQGYRGGLVLMSAQDKQVIDVVSHYADDLGLKYCGALQKSAINVTTLKKALVDNQRLSFPIRLPALQTMREGEVHRAIEQGNISYAMRAKADLEGNINHYQLLSQHRGKNETDDDYNHALFQALKHTEIAKKHISTLLDRAIQLLHTNKHSEDQLEHTISISVPTHLFHNNDIYHLILNRLGIEGIGPGSLHIELCSHDENDFSKAREVLTRMRLRGFYLILDGVGYKTVDLVSLMEMPFNEIKLHKRVVLKAGRSRIGSSLIRSVVRSVHGEGAKVTACGITRQQQLSELQKLKCDYYQGDLIAGVVSLSS